MSLGETAYLDRKWEQFWRSVAAAPLDFADRIASRFLAATLWFEPFSGTRESCVLALRRLTHPVPFLALLFLVFTSVWRRLHWAQWTVMGVYLLYMLPYIGISYYNRYAVPLLGVKVLLVIWAAD